MGSRYHEIMKTKSFLPFRMNYITDEMKERAQKELGETEEVKQNALAEMRKLVEAEPKFVCRNEDAYLLQYLRARKFNVKKAFALLQNTYLTKKAYPEVYDELDIASLRKAFKTLGSTCLPYRDEEGCVILLLQFGKWDTDEFNIQTVLNLLTSTVMFSIENPATQICGVRIMLDVRGSNLRHIRLLTPRYIHLFSKALRNCLPVRFKGIHIYNESAIFQYVWSVLKIFLTEKIKKRVHFHGDNQKNLHKFIPKAILPSEYGGEYTTFSSEEFFPNEVERFYETYQEILRSGYRK
ncbi:Alpha-tocopherol transfer protein-like protein, partial [Stegodyphus mimosarum]